MKEVLEDILMSVPKDKIDDRILTFKRDLLTKHYDEICMTKQCKKSYLNLFNHLKEILSQQQMKKQLLHHTKGTPVQ